ncbi:venom carboxylesterase-6-like [Manduca sexta]|uniref:venom carboxylesterase-6-like n=1 Tax=Manduca sexta TaxID=7130 RepID=UPI00188F2AA9|nr:venom carboxylesterase-6-like [Manduca sexta]
MSVKTALIYSVACCICFSEAVQVTVSDGTLEGAILQTVSSNKSYLSFKGISYAKPPVGSLRFMPPQPVDPWCGVKNATEHGSVCPQFDIFSGQYINGSEDCLSLNVYTPELNPVEPYPVIFFIHGGGYKSGSGDSSSYGPDFFIEKMVVTVTINYRLDALGFLCLDNEIVPGNMGLKDQVLALKWVNNNIKYFGGNPNNITIMGQSAGSTSVALHMISPMSKGLFQRAICLSGAPTSEFAIPYKQSMRAFKLGFVLGKDTDNATELLEFLQGVPAMSLVNANVAILGSDALGSTNVLKYFNFLPVTEIDFKGEHFLTVDPLEAYMKGDVHEVDVMFGTTDEEAVTAVPYFVDSIINVTANYPEMIVPKKILYNCTPDTALEVSKQITERYFGEESISVDNMKTFVSFATDSYIAVSVQRFFSYLPTRSSSHLYSYVFSSFSSRNYYGLQGVPYGIYAAGHNDDLSYLFEPHARNLTSDVNSVEYGYVNLTSTVFSNFIKYGNPTPEPVVNITWPEYDAQSKKYVNIANNTLTIESNRIGDSVSFFENIFKSVGVPF